MKNVAIVYMLAGMSSRFGGRVKGLVSVGSRGETLVDYSLQQAMHSGFSKIVFVVSPQTFRPFQERFGSVYKGVPILYAMQTYDSGERDKPWGTADAICSARPLLDCPFVVCNGDDIYGASSFRRLFNHLEIGADSATIGYKLGNHLSVSGAVNRGIFTIDSNDYVTDIRETLGISHANLEEKNLSEDDLCSMNIFALQLETLDILVERVRNFRKGLAGDRTAECYLPKELSSLISQKRMRMKLYSSQDTCLGITHPGDEEIVKKAFA